MLETLSVFLFITYGDAVILYAILSTQPLKTSLVPSPTFNADSQGSFLGCVLLYSELEYTPYTIINTADHITRYVPHFQDIHIVIVNKMLASLTRGACCITPNSGAVERPPFPLPTFMSPPCSSWMLSHRVLPLPSRRFSRYTTSLLLKRLSFHISFLSGSDIAQAMTLRATWFLY